MEDSNYQGWFLYENWQLTFFWIHECEGIHFCRCLLQFFLRTSKFCPCNSIPFFPSLSFLLFCFVNYQTVFHLNSLSFSFGLSIPFPFFYSWAELFHPNSIINVFYGNKLEFGHTLPISHFKKLVIENNICFISLSHLFDFINNM